VDDKYEVMMIVVVKRMEWMFENLKCNIWALCLSYDLLVQRVTIREGGSISYNMTDRHYKAKNLVDRVKRMKVRTFILTKPFYSGITHDYFPVLHFPQIP
jgi:hypothetical protein